MFLKYFWIVVSISFSLGLCLANIFLDFSKREEFYFFSLFLLFLILSFFFFKLNKNSYSNKLSLFLLFISFLFFGFWRYLISWPDYNDKHIIYYAKQTNRLICSIENIELKNEQQKIKAQVLKILSDKGETNVSGKILIIGEKFPLYRVGDILEVEAFLEKGSKIANFDYNLYLKRNNISLFSSYPKIKIVGELNKHFLFKKQILGIKKYLISVFDFNLSLESASLAKAILLGDKSDLSYEQKDVFSKSGLSHLVAISGLHISLLSGYFLNLLLSLGCSRRKSFYFINIFLLFYLSLIAWPPSAFRAYLMGSLSLLSVYLNRKGSVVNVLFFSAFILLIINPFLLLVDLGFQLSFLAVLGIIYIYPRFKEFLLKIIFKFKILKCKKIVANILDIFSLTLSVQLITAPILIKSFEQLSLIAPLSNLFVLWLVPFIIIFLILGLFLSFLFPFLSSLLFVPAEASFKYFNFIAEKSLLFPRAFIELKISLSFFFYFYYLLLFYFIVKTKK
jgi:competence protein ComEC